MRKSVLVAILVTYLIVSFMPGLALPQLMGKKGKKGS